jgi:hypothetical protein
MPKPAKTCIFCDKTNRSKTHIWPDWLNKLLLPPTIHAHEFEDEDTKQTTSRVRQGSIFTQKPYLACVDCNTGWMRKFEDDMLLFSTPLFISNDGISLSRAVAYPVVSGDLNV